MHLFPPPTASLLVPRLWHAPNRCADPSHVSPLTLDFAAWVENISHVPVSVANFPKHGELRPCFTRPIHHNRVGAV